MNQEDYDWSQFTISFYYSVPLDRLYRAWATSSGMESFFIEKAMFKSREKTRLVDEYVQSGDDYEWKWRHDFAVSGKILEAKKNESLAFTFGSMNVRVDFKKSEKGSLLYLHQTGITGDNKVMGHLNCRSCWVFFMTNLKSVFINGTDLRDDDPSVVSSMEVGFLPKELT